MARMDTVVAEDSVFFRWQNLTHIWWNSLKVCCQITKNNNFIWNFKTAHCTHTAHTHTRNNFQDFWIFPKTQKTQNPNRNRKRPFYKILGQQQQTADSRHHSQNAAAGSREGRGEGRGWCGWGGLAGLLKKGQESGKWKCFHKFVSTFNTVVSVLNHRIGLLPVIQPQFSIDVRLIARLSGACWFPEDWSATPPIFGLSSDSLSSGHTLQVNLVGQNLYYNPFTCTDSKQLRCARHALYFLPSDL